MKRIGMSLFVAIVIISLVCPQVMADSDNSFASGENSDTTPTTTIAPSVSNTDYIFSDGPLYTVNTGTNNGYSGKDPIKKSDPHYGWSLGDFRVSGFTSYIKEADGTVVFLKNANDIVKLSFDLKQNWNLLNGDDDLELTYDSNAYDSYFGTKVYQHAMGLFVLRKTNYQNKTEDPICYESYIEGVKRKADDTVQICEEGDYEVALDYEIEEDGSILGFIDKDSYEDYRMFFKFKVRNGNCMIFPKSIGGSELTNESFAENGFYIDFAKSRYLLISVKFSQLVKTKNGVVEDVRFSRTASDGEQYDKPGIYEITITNIYSNITEVKRIYVGGVDDQYIRMMAIDKKTLEDINKSLFETEETTVDESTTDVPEITVSEESVIEETIIQSQESQKNNSEKSDQNTKALATGCALGSVALIAIVFIIYMISKTKKKESSVVSGQEDDDSLVNNDKANETSDEISETVSSVKVDIDALPYNGRVSRNESSSDVDDKEENK